MHPLDPSDIGIYTVVKHLQKLISSYYLLLKSMKVIGNESIIFFIKFAISFDGGRAINQEVK